MRNGEVVNAEGFDPSIRPFEPDFLNHSDTYSNTYTLGICKIQGRWFKSNRKKNLT